MAVRHFDTSARESVAAVLNPVDIEFTLDEYEMVASPPTAGQLAMFLASNKMGGIEAIQGMFDFVDVVLNDDDYKIVRGLVMDGTADIGTLVDMISWMVEEWSARPTKSSPASSASQKTTGRQSTVNARSKGSKTS